MWGFYKNMVHWSKNIFRYQSLTFGTLVPALKYRPRRTKNNHGNARKGFVVVPHRFGLSTLGSFAGSVNFSTGIQLIEMLGDFLLANQKKISRAQPQSMSP
jgi:hypothetical protein